jgi:hypothetical protein
LGRREGPSERRFYAAKMPGNVKGRSMDGVSQMPQGASVELSPGVCFFHYCEAASFKDNVLFCGEAQKEVLDMTECPLGLWFRSKDGWPIERKIVPEEPIFPEPG